MILYLIWDSLSTIGEENDLFSILMCVLISLPTIAIDIVLSPFELVAYVIYRMAKKGQIK